ncbi:hypothetical protein CGCF415_v005181 [Colletotrichum fructicola]|nr:hypothetical protein CGCF415_v005181 [Colletotrichum fructicola]KAF4939809.1 hypothetical protein CGCF245_v003106 [Colletotrichum fructicola]
MSDFLSSTEFDKFLAELDSNAYAIDMGFMDLLDPIGYDDGHVGDGGLGPAAPLDPVPLQQQPHYQRQHWDSMELVSVPLPSPVGNFKPMNSM